MIMCHVLDENHQMLSGLPVLNDEIESLQMEEDTMHVTFQITNSAGLVNAGKDRYWLKTGIGSKLKGQMLRRKGEAVREQETRAANITTHREQQLVAAPRDKALVDRSATKVARNIVAEPFSRVSVTPNAGSKRLHPSLSNASVYNLQEQMLLPTSISKETETSRQTKGLVERGHPSVLKYHPDKRIWLGIYDSKLIPDLGDSPTWLMVKVSCR